MNKIFKLFSFLLIGFIFSSKVVVANQLDNVAACSGVLIGNASIDFRLGNQKAFSDGVKLAITAYMSEFLSKKYGKSNLLIADKILSSNTDKIIYAANSNTFDENVYDEIIKCYRSLGITILKNADVIKNNSAKIRNMIMTKDQLIRRLLSAG